MSIPVPSLNLAFEKTSTTTTNLSSTNSNDNSSKNIVNLNLINPIIDDLTCDGIKSPTRRSIKSNSPIRASVLSPIPELVKHPLQNKSLNIDNNDESPKPYDAGSALRLDGFVGACCKPIYKIL